MTEIKSKQELLDEVTLPENTVDMMNFYLKNYLINSGSTGCTIGLELNRLQLIKLANMLRAKDYSVCINEHALSIHI